MTAAPPVATRGLVKRYGEIVAVDGVDLTVEPGDVFGYLGPNGAGKTTSLRMLLGLIRPTEGSIELFGRDPHVQGAKALEGVAGFVEGPTFYPYLTARRNLRLLAAYDDCDSRSRIEELLELVELSDRGDDKVGGYSHGMRQRLGIAAALLRDPKLLLLDEPTTGLDPAGMRDMKTLVRRLSSEGITVMLSSHQMADVEELCNRVAIINKGRILYEGPVVDLKRSLGSWYRLRVADLEAARRVAEAFALGDVGTADGELRFSAEEAVVEQFMIALGREGVGVRALVPQQATLEQVFFDLTESDGAGPPEPAPRLEPVA